MDQLSELDKKLIGPHDTTIVVFGGSGQGKSSVLNTFLGCNFGIHCREAENALVELFQLLQDKQEIFPTSSDPNAMTQETRSHLGFWFGNPEFGRLLAVDTPGLGDPRGAEMDARHTSDMVDKLKALCSPVNMFLLVFNAMHPRFDDLQRELIRIFQKTFGDAVWNNVAVVFTNWESDEFSVQRRARQYPGKDPQVEKSESLKKELKELVGTDIKNFFFLSCDPNIQPGLAEGTISNLLQIRKTALAAQPFWCDNAKKVQRDIIIERIEKERIAEQKRLADIAAKQAHERYLREQAARQAEEEKRKEAEYNVRREATKAIKWYHTEGTCKARWGGRGAHWTCCKAGLGNPGCQHVYEYTMPPYRQ